MSTIINRNYNATDIDNPSTNPVNINVETDTTIPSTIELTFTRSQSTDTSCKICQYRFDKADIQQLYAYLGDALYWLDYQDNNQNPDSNQPKPVPPGPSDCDKNPKCTNCVGGNIPTPPLGPYDPDYWPTIR